MTDKELDDLFQKELTGHGMPVPPDMWERVNPQKEKRRRAIIWWWSGLGAAALFILIGTATWLYRSSPEKNAVAATAIQPANRQPDNDSAKRTTPLSQPPELHRKMDLPDVLPKQETSSQAAQLNKEKGNHARNVYTSQSNRKKNTGIAINKLQNATSYQASSIEKNEAGKSIANNEQANNEAGSQRRAEISESQTLIDSNATALQSNQSTASAKTPDSSAIIAGNTTTQKSKASAVKVKKMPGEKAASFELMVAGYGNSRNVYDADFSNRTSLVPFGPVGQKEKVLMNSFSITARVDKPLTKNISLKTGLQFMQTYQQVSYHYETVSQTFTINATNSDTMVLARLQSKQSLVKGTYNSLSVPVLVSYHTNGKLNLGATAGVLVNVLSWYKGSVPDAGNSQVVAAKNTFRTHTGTSLYAGLTAAKQIGKFQLFAGPHLQYTLSSITKSSASFRQKITSYGFGIGIRKKIGK